MCLIDISYKYSFKTAHLTFLQTDSTDRLKEIKMICIIRMKFNFDFDFSFFLFQVRTRMVLQKRFYAHARYLFETSLIQSFDLGRVFLCVNNCSMKKSFRQQVGRPAIQVFSWHTSRQLLYAATFFLFQTTVKLIFWFYFQSTVPSTSSKQGQIISGVKKAFFSFISSPELFKKMMFCKVKVL